MRRLRLLLPLFLALLPLRVASAQELDVATWRERMLAIAAAYADHEWTATERNRVHGEDPDGVWVDTPDVSFSERGWRPGERFRGVPYAWGGFSSLEEFDAGLEQGLFAGHIHRHRRSASSRSAVGVDCSGFVSRCWELPEKQSTRSLGELCYPLEGYAQLEPGDVLNRYDAHVMLFAGWVDEARSRARVFEAVDPCVLENEYEVATLQGSGFVPLRYRPLDARWAEDAVDFTGPSLALPAGGAVAFEPSGEERAVAPEAIGLPYARAAVGQWVRFERSTRATRDGEPERDRVSLGVAEAEASELTLHRNVADPGTHGLDRFLVQGRDTSALDTWIELVLTAGVPERSRTIHALTLQEGSVTLAGEPRAAQRARAEVEIVYAAGPDGVSVWLSLEGTLTEAVPLHGLLALDARLEIVDGPQPRVVETSVVLSACRSSSLEPSLGVTAGR